MRRFSIILFLATLLTAGRFCHLKADPDCPRSSAVIGVSAFVTDPMGVLPPAATLQRSDIATPAAAESRLSHLRLPRGTSAVVQFSGGSKVNTNFVDRVVTPLIFANPPGPSSPAPCTVTVIITGL